MRLKKARSKAPKATTKGKNADVERAQRQSAQQKLHIGKTAVLDVPKNMQLQILAIQPAQPQIKDAFVLYFGVNQLALEIAFLWVFGFLLLLVLQFFDKLANDLCRLHHHDDCGRDSKYGKFQQKRCYRSKGNVGNVNCLVHKNEGGTNKVFVLVLRAKMRNVRAPNCNWDVEHEHNCEHKEQIACNTHFLVVQAYQND